MTIPYPLDQRAWYPMASLRMTKRLQVGGYYSHYVNKTADPSLLENYSTDWVVSGRYDFHDYLCRKLEGHFLHRTGLRYYRSTMPDGLRPNSNMLVARIGFSFLVLGGPMKHSGTTLAYALGLGFILSCAAIQAQDDWSWRIRAASISQIGAAESAASSLACTRASAMAPGPFR